jgi:hypothetical protein
MTSLQFRFLDYSNRAAALVYTRLCGPRRLVDEFPLTALCQSFASFEKEIDRLHFELEELRHEAQLRWAEHEARAYNLVRDGDSRGTTR